MLDFWLCSIPTNDAEWEEGGRHGASNQCTFYVTVCFYFLFFKKYDQRNKTLTEEWDGHFLFNEKKKM